MSTHRHEKLESCFPKTIFFLNSKIIDDSSEIYIRFPMKSYQGEKWLERETLFFLTGIYFLFLKKDVIKKKSPSSVTHLPSYPT